MGTASTAPHNASSAASPTLATWHGAAQSMNVLIQGGPKNCKQPRSFTQLVKAVYWGRASPTAWIREDVPASKCPRCFYCRRENGGLGIWEGKWRKQDAAWRIKDTGSMMENRRHSMKGECRIRDARCRVDGTGHRRQVARWKMNTEQKMQDEGQRCCMGDEEHRTQDAGRRIQGSKR